MSETDEPAKEPVSVVVRRRIYPELQPEFEVWLDGVMQAAANFEGHLGAQVLRPPDPAVQDYVLLFRFERAHQLQAWEASEVRADWLRRGERYTMGTAHVQQVTGLEFWFRIPGSAARNAPPRHRMVVATVVGLFPMILWLVPVLNRVFSSMPRPLSTLLGTLLVVILMTYVVMPLVTRVLARWLFAPPRK